MTWVFLLKNGSRHLVMLGVKFGWNSLIGFREYDVYKRGQYILTILFISPRTSLNRLEFSLSMNTSWHWSENCLCLVFCYYLHLQNGVVSVTKDSFHAEFILIYISASFVSMQFETHLQPTLICNYPPPLLKKVNQILYSIPYISWLIHSRVAFGDKEKVFCKCICKKSFV